MPLMILPYLLQLLCLVHIVKTHRNTYWIWIVIAVPYIGGLAYLILEIIPGLSSAPRIHSVKDQLTDLVKPNGKFEIIEQKARFSPTFKNMVEYADALMARNDYGKALEIYTAQNAGAFRNDPELVYRTASALYRMERYPDAKKTIVELMETNESFRKKSRENLLYLAIIEKTESPDFVRDEYQKTLHRIQNNSIEIPYIEFLMNNDYTAELETIFARIHLDEQSMKVNKVRYNRAFYSAVYQLERKLRARKP